MFTEDLTPLTKLYFLTGVDSLNEFLKQSHSFSILWNLQYSLLSEILSFYLEKLKHKAFTFLVVLTYYDIYYFYIPFVSQYFLF